MLRWCLVRVICNSNSVYFFFFQTLHNDTSHIEDVHLLFCAHLISIFLFLTDVELKHLSIQNCLLVSGSCNLLLQQFSFFCIQTLHNDCSHIEDVHLLFSTHFMIFTFIFWGLELRLFP